MLGLLKKIFGTAQSRQIKGFSRIVKRINEREEELQSWSTDRLKEETENFKKRIAAGETPDDLLIEAYAVVKNACRRLVGKQIHVSGYDQQWDMVPYDVQLIGAIAMHHGSIAEMQTGEGKTLTAAMPLYLHALTGKPVHIVTVNDYLAARDCEWVGEIFRFLGLTTAALTNGSPPGERKTLYASDIVYGTASEFGFDYLRDNSMATSKREQCQRGYYFAIIDEVDSILIDEARTPLIISGPSAQSKQMYKELSAPVNHLVKEQRDISNRLASEAKKTLDKLAMTTESEEKPKLSKDESEEAKEAMRKLWLVSKSTPTNKILKRIKEHPDLRHELEKWETYFHAEPNKKERSEALAELYIIIDERSSEYELTDRGIAFWAKTAEREDDFVMLDLGFEYSKIDQDESLTDEMKLQKKTLLREEDGRRKERTHNVRQLFRAHLLMEKDVDYIVQEGKIVIIDENTGRPQPGRRFSDGLHQAIEAKEGVSIQQETQTYASITLQNYFRLYERLAGMTGTAMTEAQEFKEIYKLQVIAIPSHRKNQRKDENDEVYMTEREKYNAILKEIETKHNEGRPILLGTESVDVSEKLSRILKNAKLPHTVLNAKNHAKEAEIIAMAGQKGAITVATNMAGRGTDIKLGKDVADCGGLHVIGTTRHQSRRIDRQLRGRSARQGDPGSSKFFVSFEDSLMRLFASNRLTSMLQKYRPPEGEPLSAPILNRSIETAQKRVEQRNYTIRKHTLEYDDVMNKQRSEIYTFRNEVLGNNKPYNMIFEVVENFCSFTSSRFFRDKTDENGWDAKGYRDFLQSHFPVTIEENLFDDEHLTLEQIETLAAEKVISALKKKLSHEAKKIATLQQLSGKEASPVPVLCDILRSLLIKCIDRNWQDHLLSIDHLRTEVGMRTLAQKDPLLEFKHEAFALFDEFSKTIQTEICHAVFNFEMVLPDSPEVRDAISRMQLLSPLKTFLNFEEGEEVTLHHQ